MQRLLKMAISGWKPIKTEAITHFLASA